MIAVLSSCDSKPEPCGTIPDSAAPHGAVVETSFPEFLEGRTCFVYTPHASQLRSGAAVPLLIMTDGERLFRSAAGWKLDQLLDGLIASDRIVPLEVVGIASSVTDREGEYDPHVFARGRNGELFVKAIVDTLLPILRARSPVPLDTSATGIAGASLGGLLAAYAGYARSDVFHRVIALSPSYYWPVPPFVTEARSLPRPRLDRFYQVTGANDDNPIDDMRDVMLQQGFVLGRDFQSVVVPGAGHADRCWAYEMDEALRFTFSASR